MLYVQIRKMCLAIFFVLIHLSVLATQPRFDSVYLQRNDTGIYLDVKVDLTLPTVVEEAVRKGVAITFVYDAKLYKNRWYWSDKNIATAKRILRLSYQPITEKWRVSSKYINNKDEAVSDVALTQSFSSLTDALRVISQSLSWRIAEAQDIEANTEDYLLDLNFKLDINQLPRPFQLSLIGAQEWQMQVKKKYALDNSKMTFNLVLQ